MQVLGSAALRDLLGDCVAYRSLQPFDARLPGAVALTGQLGIAPGTPLRKGDAAYAQVAAAILQAARELDKPGMPLRRLLFVGDTRLSDGGAFASLCAATGWPGRAFIGQDAPDAAPETTREGNVTFANRWAALPDFAAALDSEGFPIDAHTAVVLDIDKTLLGARGRNAALIDAARVRALRQSVAEALGGAFDEAEFAHIYQTIDKPRFHPLTADNQDYVGYVCIIVAARLYELAQLVDQAEAGRLPNFAAFLVHVADAGAANGRPSPGVAAFHTDITRQVAAGDPTPFKAFRRREYQETVALLGRSPADTPAEQLLREEVVLTGEVWQAAQVWQARGALLFGLSDKPDEAALPPPGGPGAPLHHIQTHIVGS